METKNADKTRRTMKGQNLPIMSEDEARALIEKLLWPDGPVCPHCGSVNVYRMTGETCRDGLHRCREKECEKQFTVTVGTIFEDSHIPLAKWVLAFHLMVSSKKGISSLQLQRNLGLGSYRTAWHMAHRIRLAMRCEPMAGLLTGIVESDEAWIGGKPRKIAGRGGCQGKTDKQPVQTLIQRDGQKITRVVADVTAANLRANIDALVDKKNTTLMTDEWKGYRKLGREFKGGHKTVQHSVYEYAKPGGIHINNAESSHALIKRSIYGTFHHVSKVHLQRYLDESDFKWNGRKVDDVARRERALRQSVGKRLMYKQPIK